MGLLRRITTGIGDVVKGAVNEIPVFGGISKSVFGQVGSRGIVGRIGGSPNRNGGGLTAASSLAPMNIPQIPQNIPTRFRQSDPGQTNGQHLGFASDLTALLGSNQIVMEPQMKTIHSAPPGWVIVTMPDGSKKAVLKDVAKCLGLWKARSKPPITAGQWKTLKKARSVEKKAKRIAEAANFKCTYKKTGR